MTALTRAARATTTEAPVALAATLHDPHAADLPNMLTALPELTMLYTGMVIVATAETPAPVLAPLRAAGAQVIQRPSEYREIGWRRLEAVQGAAELAPAIHLCDFDRLLHWWLNWSEELAAVLARITTTDLLILGRTTRAWATHPANQIETEGLANQTVSHFYGAEVDICSGSRGLSRRAVAYLTAHGREHSVGTDAEWPLLLRAAREFRCEQLLTEGLEFETGDRYPQEVSQAGGLVGWNAGLDRDAERWTFRVRLAGDIVMAALRTAAR